MQQTKVTVPRCTFVLSTRSRMADSATSTPRERPAASAACAGSLPGGARTARQSALSRLDCQKRSIWLGAVPLPRPSSFSGAEAKRAPWTAPVDSVSICGSGTLEDARAAAAQASRSWPSVSR